VIRPWEGNDARSHGHRRRAVRARCRQPRWRIHGEPAGAGCSLVEGVASSPAPGAGRCWAKDHDPAVDQPLSAIDVGADPNSPDHGHDERCSGYAEPLDPARNRVVARDAFDAGRPATPPLPTACQAGRRRIKTVEATDVARAGRKGVLMRAYNQNWIFDMSRPAAKTRDADSVSFVF
jgi:hypothetical protein